MIPAPSGASRSESSNLDFLRAIAVLSVYVFHLLYTLGLSHVPTLDVKADWGWLLGRFGVLVFFVHTSLVLMMSLERMESSNRPLFSGFYIRRFFRIYPLSMAVVAIVVIFHLPRSPHVGWSDPGWSTILANFLLCTNLLHKANIVSVLWSLPLEVQMYVLLPFVFLIGKKYGMRGIGVLWLGAVIATYTKLNLTASIPCFMAGVISYFAGFGFVRRRLPFIGWALTIAAAAGIFLAFGSAFRSEVAWLICLIIGLGAPLFAELEFQPLRKMSAQIARYSYGIYLTHTYALWTAFIVMKNQPLVVRCVVLVALSLGLPVLFYWFLESPMIALGGRLANRLPASTHSERARTQRTAVAASAPTSPETKFQTPPVDVASAGDR